MRFAALGSGSRGNAWLVEHGATRVLVDCGFGPRELARRLARLGVEAESVAAVVVTHEHSDHYAGVGPCSRRFGWPAYMTRGTAVAGGLEGVAVSWVANAERFLIGDLEFLPFTVPHDAREPVQLRIDSADGCRLGLVTDAGHVTAHMAASLANCTALVVECNHDGEMLAGGRYPYHLKQRIAGRWGHLENREAAQLLRQVWHTGLRCVVAAHLSAENNRIDLARHCLAQVLDCPQETIAVATQEEGLGWRAA